MKTSNADIWFSIIASLGVIVNVNENVNIPFGDFWDLYAKKRGEKGKLEIKWNKLTDDERVKIMQPP